ncbi:MAG: tetratricopeptide repeat protein [Polyangiaceae bacterium]|nr:tetratricopeptide repeat protein [Polyangiaceae bacterium]
MLKLETLNEVLAEKLTNPGEVLDVLVTALAKGHHPAAEWEALHVAAARDGVIAEMAFAYEGALSGRRIKLVSPTNQAEAFLHAAEFLSEQFNDRDGAIGYAERALAAVPTHESAFALLERLLRAKGDLARLARAYLDLASGERDRERQLAELRQAAVILEGVTGADDLAIDVHQRILRQEPTDAASLTTLTARYAAAGKHRESARLLEQALARAEGPEAQPLRQQLIRLYCDELGEPPRAMPHVEALLVEVPGDERALAAAEALLENKVMAPRAVTALANAYAALGKHDLAAEMLMRELRIARGPRKVEVQKRLAILKQDVLNDPTSALELLGPALTADPGDDDLRRRFVELSLALNQPLDAAKLLGRALQAATDPAVKARIGATLGSVYQSSGDVKRAQTEYEGVLEAAADDAATLSAASKLVELCAEAGDQKRLAQYLEIVMRLESEGAARIAAARRLARVCDDLGDSARGTPAWEALLGSEWEDEALSRLQVHYEKLGQHEKLGDVLERRSQRCADPAEARELAFRAADLRSTRTRDRSVALQAWETFLASFGGSREAHARVLPLLEQEKRWEDMARVLNAEVELAPFAEQAAIHGRIGQLRAARLDDPQGAVRAFREALRIDTSEPTSRAALEKLTSVSGVELEAAELLEPLYRAEGRAQDLARVLELRARTHPDLEVRLAAIDEATSIAQGGLAEPEWALSLAGRGLAAVAASSPSQIPHWLARVLDLAIAASSPTLRAQVLAEALGDRPIDGPEVLALARATAEALAATDEVERAIATYRRALDHDPSSSELLQKVDELLALQGSPDERLALYRNALLQPCDPTRRQELLHAMARVQRRDLGDIEGAILTWQRAIEVDPRDHAAHQGLVDALTEQKRWADLCTELARVLELVPPDRRSSVLTRMAEVELLRGNRSAALQHYEALVETGTLDDARLATVEELATEEGLVSLQRAVLERRVGLAVEAEVKSSLLERLGSVLADAVGDPAGAAAVWMEAARLREADTAGEAPARGLYEAVLRAVPEHREAADRLVDLCAAAGDWGRVGAAFQVLVDRAESDGELVTRLSSLEPRALAAGGSATFAALVDTALRYRGLTPIREQELWLVKARVLAAEPGREDEVAAIHRRLIESDAEMASPAAESFGRFLSQAPPSQSRVEDRRWLFEWRAGHASDPAAVLLAWAAVEEQQLGDPTRAIALYRRVLERDPGRLDALNELARLQAATGDAKAAVEALAALRAESEGEALAAIDARIATLLLGPLGRPAEALDVAAGVLEVAPTDAVALDVVRGVLEIPSLAPKAASVLERVSEAADDPQARATVLESLLALNPSGADLGMARRRWFERLLECREEDPEASLAIALRGAREHPDAEPLWNVAERIARRLQRPEPVADAYAAVLDGKITAELAEDVGRRMVEFHEEWFEEPDRVVGLLKRVLDLAPAADWAFDRLKLAFNAAARWEELFALYDRALARTTEDPTRIVLLREAAMAAKDFAADAPRAIGYLEQLLSLVPTDVTVEGTLERLYEREGMLRALIELFTRRFPRAMPTELHDLRRRVVELWIAVGEAIPAFEVLTDMRSDPDAGSETYELLERVIELDTARSSVAPNVRPRRGRQISVREHGASFLREYYESIDRISDMARMMEVGLDFARSDRERIARLTEIVELRLHRLDDPAGAFQNVSSLVALEPSLGAHRRLLAELAERIGAQPARAALLAAVARERPEPALRAELLREAAAVHVEVLDEPAAAIELYSEVLALAGEDRDLALGAARDLDPLLAAAGRPDEHCSVLEQRAALEIGTAARRSAYSMAAKIAADVLGDLERAVRDYRHCLVDDPGDREALDGLVGVLDRAGHYPDLIEALAARARTVADPAQVHADLVRIARLYGEVLGARPAAVEAWREVRQRCGRDRESFDALIPLLETEARWADLAELVAIEAADEEDEDRQRALCRQLGLIHRTRTQRPSLAIRSFVAADDWDEAITTAGNPDLPRDVGLEVCQELMELAVTAWEDPQAASLGAARAAAWSIEELSSRLRGLGRHAAVAELLLRASTLPFDRRRRRELRRDAACVCQDQLGDGDRAIEILREIFADDAGDEVANGTVTRLAKLLEERALHGEIAELWEAQARSRQAGGERAAAAALWSRAAELWEKRAGNIERAIADFRAGAGLGGEIALEALARIHHVRGEHRAVAEALEWLCAQSTREALADRALRLANAYVACGERRYARARLERAAAVALDASSVRKRLAELYREDKDWAPLAALLTTEAARAPDPKSRLALLVEAAGFHLDMRGQPNDAVPLLEQAVELDPDDPDRRLSLSRALELAGRFDEATQILRQQIELYGARRPKSRAIVHFQLARVSLAAGCRAEAIAELELANRIDPAHPGILQALGRIAFEEGQLERAEKTYRALLLVVRPAEDPNAPSRSEALLDLGDIAGQLGDPVRAAEFVESAFETALEHPQEVRFLEESLRRRGRIDLLARALESRLARAPGPEDAARALADLTTLHAGEAAGGGAGLAKETLRDQARTIQAALENAGVTAEEPWSAIARVYDFLGDGDAELRVLERRVAMWQAAGQTPPDAAPFYRLAEIRLGARATREEGLSLLERALAIRSDPARAIAALRATLDADSTATRAIELLERLARQSGDQVVLAAALTWRLGGPSSDFSVLREAASLASQIGDRVLHERILRRGLELDLPDADAAWVRTSLAAVANATGDREAAVELQVAAALLLGGEGGHRELLQAAATLRDELGAPDRAANIYQQLLAVEPGDRAAWEPLLAILRELGRNDELLALIERTVPLVDSTPDRSRLRLEQAGLELARGDDDTAADTLQGVLDDDPTQAKAALLLAGILERAGRKDELVALLERQLDAAKDRGDVESVVSLGLRIGSLHETQGRPEAAFDAYQSVLDWDARSRPALEAVVRMAAVRGDPFAHAEALEALLGVVSGDGARPLAERLLAIRSDFGDPDDVARALALAFAAVPTHAPFREAYIARNLERGDHAAVAEALRRAVELTPDDAVLVERLIEAHRAGGRPEAALSILQEVLAAAPNRVSLLPQRAALYSELGRAEEALADIEQAHDARLVSDDDLIAALERAQEVANPERAREIALRLVTVFESREELEQARHSLAELARRDPRDCEVLRHLAEIEVRMGNWDGATRAYRQLIGLEEDEMLVAAALHLFDACANAGRIGDALGGLERALKIAPEHPVLKARLRDVYEATGENRLLARLLEEEAARTAEGSEAFGLLLRAGEVLLELEGDVGEAIRVLESARGLSPENLSGVALLGRALGAAGRGEEAMRLLTETIEAHRGRRVKTLASVYVEVSRFHLEDGMLTDAMESLQKAFDVDPKNAAIAMQLGQLGLEMEEHDVAGKAFRAASAMKPYDVETGEGITSDAKADAQYCLAWLAFNEGDARKARTLAMKALTENPDHELARTLLEEVGG